MKSTGKLKFIIILIIIACMGLIAYVAITEKQKTATLDTLYTPMSAELLINGTRQKDTSIRLKPGKYTVSIKKDGFFEYSETITLNGGSTRSISTILSPNSANTMNWYNEHEDDKRVTDTITSRLLSSKAKIIEKNFPIGKILPYINARGTFRIDYGKGNNPESQALYITYVSDVAKDLALDFIRQSGYNPDDYEIIYQEVEFL